MCGEVESEEHVLLNCNLYMDVRRRWKGKLASMNAIKYNAIMLYKVMRQKIIVLKEKLSGIWVWYGRLETGN